MGKKSEYTEISILVKSPSHPMGKPKERETERINDYVCVRDRDRETEMSSQPRLFHPL